MYLIQNLKNKSDKFKLYDFYDNLTTSQGIDLFELEGVKPINIFIGANNSRKSRLIRQIFVDQSFISESKLSNFILDFLPYCELLKNNISQQVRISENSSTRIWALYNDSDYKSIKEILPQNTSIHGLVVGIRDIENYENMAIDYFFNPSQKSRLSTSQSTYKLTYVLFHYFNALKNEVGLSQVFSFNGINIESFKDIDFDKIIKCLNFLSDNKHSETSIIPKKKIYIPIFRTSHSFYESGKRKEYDMFLNSTIMNFFPNFISDNDVISRIYTGFDFNEKVLTSRNSIKPIREKFDKFQKFIGDEFFNGKAVDIIGNYSRNSDEKVIKIHIEGEGGYDAPINELGDGIQALILMLYPIFMANSEEWFLIEEPELNLHPGYQKIFIKTIVQHPEIKDKNLKFFFTTHSNHFIESAVEYPNDIALYRIQKHFKDNESNFSAIDLISDDYTSVLNAIGVNNLSVMLANCSIWIEGNSDRRIIGAFIKAYLEANDIGFSPQEGLHFSFFEYGGSLLGHYIFPEDNVHDDKINAKFLANRIFLLADEDLNKNKKHDKYRKLTEANNNKSSLKFVYSTTIGVEIENILTKKMLMMFAKEFLGVSSSSELHKFETLKDSDLKKKKIGNVIQECLPSLKKKFKLDNGSLTGDYKGKLSGFIAEKIDSGVFDWNEIKTNKSAKVIIENMISFIKKHNPQVSEN